MKPLSLVIPIALAVATAAAWSGIRASADPLDISKGRGVAQGPGAAPAPPATPAPPSPPSPPAPPAAPAPRPQEAPVVRALPPTPPVPPDEAEGSDELRALLGQAPGGGYLGVGIQEVTPEAVKELGLKEERGVLIQEVRENSAAARAGLKPKDVIVSFNGDRIEGLTQFTRLLRETPAGRPITLGIIREGRHQDIKATLDSRSKERRLIDPQIHIEAPDLSTMGKVKIPEIVWAYGNRGRLGIQVQTITTQLAEYFGVESKHGLLVSTVNADSPAAKAGIRAGDVIVAVDDKQVEDADDLSKALRGRSGDVNLTIVRDRQRQNVKVTLEASESRRRIERRYFRHPRVIAVSARSSA